MYQKTSFSLLIKKRILLLFLLPALFFFLAFFIYPIFENLRLAFTNKSLYHFYQYDFVGLRNFKDIFISPEFYPVLARTFLWLICTVFLQVIFGLFFSLFFTSPSLAARNIYRALILLPWAVPNVVMILVWRGMFNPTFGVINFILGKKISWYASPWHAFLMIQIVNIWLAYPFLTLLLTGAIQSIPAELKELAKIEGCNSIQELRYITLPIIKPILSYGILLTSATAFMQFPVIWLLTRGGPGGATDILMTWAYKEAFYSQRYGFHASIAIFASLVSIIFAFFIIKRGGLLEKGIK